MLARLALLPCRVAIELKARVGGQHLRRSVRPRGVPRRGGSDDRLGGERRCWRRRSSPTGCAARPGLPSVTLLMYPLTRRGNGSVQPSGGSARRCCSRASTPRREASGMRWRRTQQRSRSVGRSSSTLGSSGIAGASGPDRDEPEPVTRGLAAMAGTWIAERIGQVLERSEALDQAPASRPRLLQGRPAPPCAVEDRAV